MAASVPAVTLLRWAAFYGQDPWSEERDDLRAGMVAAELRNLFTRGRRWQPRDFLLVRPTRQASSVDDQVRLLKGLAAVGIGRWQSAT